MPLWSKVLLIAAGVLVGLLVVDRLALWMESRGWIYWRKVKPKGGGMAAGLTAMHTLVEPEVRYVIEDRDSRRIAEADRETPGDGR
jgi:hypothetical protein